MLSFDQNRMQQVIQAAFDKATGHKRWESAIVRAKQIIKTNPYLHIQDDGTLLILSDSNQLYEVTDEHCPASYPRRVCVSQP